MTCGGSCYLHTLPIDDTYSPLNSHALRQMAGKGGVIIFGGLDVPFESVWDGAAAAIEVPKRVAS